MGAYVAIPAAGAAEPPAPDPAPQLVPAPAAAAPARFQCLYEGGDGRLCLFETADGHLVSVDARRLA